MQTISNFPICVAVKCTGIIQARDEVLLNPKNRHVERMPDILRVQREQDWVVHRHDQRAHYDVVASRHIVLRIQTKVISVRFIYHFGMEGTKLAVRTRIAEPKGKLFGLYVNVQGIGSGWHIVNRSPSLRAQKGESQNLDARPQ